jgi:hypothetical protein
MQWENIFILTITIRAKGIKKNQRCFKEGLTEIGAMLSNRADLCLTKSG